MLFYLVLSYVMLCYVMLSYLFHWNDPRATTHFIKVTSSSLRCVSWCIMGPCIMPFWHSCFVVHYGTLYYETLITDVIHPRCCINGVLMRR